MNRGMIPGKYRSVLSVSSTMVFLIIKKKGLSEGSSCKAQAPKQRLRVFVGLCCVLLKKIGKAF